MQHLLLGACAAMVLQLTLRPVQKTTLLQARLLFSGKVDSQVRTNPPLASLADNSCKPSQNCMNGEAPVSPCSRDADNHSRYKTQMTSQDGVSMFTLCTIQPLARKSSPVNPNSLVLWDKDTNEAADFALLCFEPDSMLAHVTPVQELMACTGQDFKPNRQHRGSAAIPAATVGRSRPKRQAAPSPCPPAAELGRLCC